MDAATPHPSFLTTREVADLLRVKERKIYEMAAAGAIPCRRVTGKLLFPKAELDAWLEGGRSQAAVEARPAILAGSHDPLLDWAIRESGSEIATFFDGSLDGLDRLAAAGAMATGLHVYDPDADDWNLPLVRARFADEPVVLIEWARRQQGLIVGPDLAASIRSAADLADRHVVRRQDSAGAAILLNHLLSAAGVTDSVRFTDDIARTEADAAAAVADGHADAAPGLDALARQYGLAFVPTKMERFDLLIDRKSWFEQPFQALDRFCRGDAFVAKATALGGYDVSGYGRVRWNGA